MLFQQKKQTQTLAFPLCSIGVDGDAGQLTGFSDTEDFTQDVRELDAAPGERTLVFVFSAAVLQDELFKTRGRFVLAAQTARGGLMLNMFSIACFHVNPSTFMMDLHLASTIYKNNKKDVRPLHWIYFTQNINIHGTTNLVKK